MKKIIILVVCLALCVCCFTACGNKTEEVIENNDVVSSEPVVEESKTEEIKDEAVNNIEENKSEKIEDSEVEEIEKLVVDKSIFERIDGSTATIPVSEALALDLFGDEAGKVKINHTRTSNAYQRLIDGEVDLIFVTPPSLEEQKKLSNVKDKKFEIEKFAKEGFVFLVNKDNKLDNLSFDQIQGIYKDEIKNWKDVGGEDADIKAFQRPENSGSQTLMYKLVGSKEEISKSAEIEVIPDMMGLVEAVADYDGGKDSIGYSVYYYINDMIELGNSKLISVNGVEPNASTIKDGSYPLVDGYYMVYNANLKSDDDIYKIINYIRSAAGQEMVEDAGYIAVE